MKSLKLLSFLILFTIACKTEKAINNKKYISNPVDTNYIFDTILKNNYFLKYRVYIDLKSSDTIQGIFLIKGKTEIKELNSISLGLPFKNLGYIGKDLEDSFYFIQSFGSGNPHFAQLIEKKTGNTIKQGEFINSLNEIDN